MSNNHSPDTSQDGRAADAPPAPDPDARALRLAGPSTVATVAVAAAHGRSGDPYHLAYLAALRRLAGRSRRDQRAGVEQMIVLLGHAGHAGAARAALDEFIAGSLTRAGDTSTVGLARALTALEEPVERGPEPPPGPAEPRRATLRRLWAMVGILRRGVRQERAMFAVAVAGSLLYSTLTVGMAYALYRWYLTAGAGPVGSWSLALSGVAVAALLVGRAVGQFAQRLGARVVQIRLRARYQRLVADDYVDLSMRWHRRHPAGARIGTARSDTENAWRPVAALPVAAGGAVIVAATLAALVRLDPRVAGVGVVLLVALLGANLAYLLVVNPYVARAKAMRAEVFALSGGLGQSSRRRERFERASARLRGAVLRVRTVRSVFDPLIAALPAFAGLAVVGILALDGRTGADGRLLASLFLFTVIASPVRSAGALLAELAGGAPAVQRLEHVLSAGERMTYGAGSARPSALPAPRTSPGLISGGRRAGAPAAMSFESVTVAEDELRPILRDVTLELGRGRLIAVVGASGAGRSAFAMLAARRFDPDLGTVRLGGTDLRSLRPEVLDEAIAFVPAAPHLYDGTVRSTVALGRERVSDQEVWRALRAVKEDRFVARLATGIDSPVRAGGVRFSRRQYRRLLVAGALAGRPQLLVLDADGDEFDAGLLGSIRRYHDATILVVTEQAQAIRSADEVVYIDADGSIVAQPHMTLMRTNLAYRRLFRGYPGPSGPPRRPGDGPRRSTDALSAPPNRAYVRQGPIEFLAAAAGTASSVVLAGPRPAGPAGDPARKVETC
ncbi:ABC transporter ATP-binding protein [Dactylosporangium sp. NPDC049140]|uniref:ABC transporter ATP-binding protein n=1 Tax=Dactylosporangium sp. NPDC049140 TaxID=3155647 RepID=UPI0033CFFBF8